MFAKNVFGSHLESIICKTINVRAPVRVARRPCACLAFTYHRGVYIYPCGSKVNSAYGSGGKY